jgi:hypothetical protein
MKLIISSLTYIIQSLFQSHRRLVCLKRKESKAKVRVGMLRSANSWKQGHFAALAFHNLQSMAQMKSHIILQRPVLHRAAASTRFN